MGAGTGRPGYCVNAVTSSGCVGVCPRTSHLRRSAWAAANGRAFFLLEILRERKKSLQCGTMRSSRDGDNLEVLPDVANLEVSFGPRGTDVQIRRLAWLLCIASRLSNSVLSSIMRPYTPHAGRRWHIHPAIRSGMERAEPRANAFDPDSTGTDIRVRRARYESELQR